MRVHPLKQTFAVVVFLVAAVFHCVGCYAQIEPDIRMAYLVSAPEYRDANGPGHRLVLADENGVEKKTIGGFSMTNQWSPDGERILLQLESPEISAVPILAVMGLDLKPRQVQGQVSEFYFDNPVWSADGKSVLVVGMQQGIVSVGVDDTGVSVLCPEGKDVRVHGVYPSPDGKKFAVTGYELPYDSQRNNDVFIMETDCSKPVRLTTDQPRPSNIRWSLDGKRIAFVDSPPGITDNKVVVMDADGQNRQEFKEGYHNTVSWTDDGRLLTTWLDMSVTENPISFLGIIDPATGSATVLRKGVGLDLVAAEWRPRKR